MQFGDGIGCTISKLNGVIKTKISILLTILIYTVSCNLSDFERMKIFALTRLGDSFGPSFIYSKVMMSKKKKKMLIDPNKDQTKGKASSFKVPFES